MSDFTDYREAILILVYSRGAITDRDLLVDSMGYINPAIFNKEKHEHELTLLITEGKVVCWNVLIDGTPRKLYFPEGTTVDHERNKEIKIRTSTSKQGNSV